MTTRLLDVKLTVQLPLGENLQAIHILVNGLPAAVARGMKPVQASSAPNPDGGTASAATYLVSVPIPASNCTLESVAEGMHSRSRPVVTRLRWRGASIGAEQSRIQKPELYVLSIGVSDYKRADLRLHFAAKDAQEIAAVFTDQKGGLYSKVTTRVLVDREATKGNILDGLEWLQRQTTVRDVAVLFLAGHGITDPSTSAYYFLPYDADPGAVKRTMLPDTDLRSTLANIVGKTLFFIDTCHSGKVFAGTQSRDGDGLLSLKSFIEELKSADNGVVVFTASGQKQAAQEAVAWKNGAFTRAVVEGLKGNAAGGESGPVTIMMLSKYVIDRVKLLTHGSQTPTFAIPTTISDFPVAFNSSITEADVAIVR